MWSTTRCCLAIRSPVPRTLTVTRPPAAVVHPSDSIHRSRCSRTSPVSAETTCTAAISSIGIDVLPLVIAVTPACAIQVASWTDCRRGRPRPSPACHRRRRRGRRRCRPTGVGARHVDVGAPAVTGQRERSVQFRRRHRRHRHGTHRGSRHRRAGRTRPDRTATNTPSASTTAAAAVTVAATQRERRRRQLTFSRSASSTSGRNGGGSAALSVAAAISSRSSSANNAGMPLSSATAIAARRADTEVCLVFAALIARQRTQHVGRVPHLVRIVAGRLSGATASGIPAGEVSCHRVTPISCNVNRAPGPRSASVILRCPPRSADPPLSARSSNPDNTSAGSRRGVRVTTVPLRRRAAVGPARC